MQAHAVPWFFETFQEWRKQQHPPHPTPQPPKQIYQIRYLMLKTGWFYSSSTCHGLLFFSEWVLISLNKSNEQLQVTEENRPTIFRMPFFVAVISNFSF